MFSLNVGNVFVVSENHVTEISIFINVGSDVSLLFPVGEMEGYLDQLVFDQMAPKTHTQKQPLQCSLLTKKSSKFQLYWTKGSKFMLS